MLRVLQCKKVQGKGERFERQRDRILMTEETVSRIGPDGDG